MLESMAAIQPIIEQELAKSPDNLSLLRRIAEIYRRQGQLSKAKSVYERLLLSEPDDLYLKAINNLITCLLYTSPSPRDA